MIAMLDGDLEVTAADYNRLVEAVNDLLASRESRRRAEAFDLLIRMVKMREESGTDLPLALAHTSHDGEEIISLLIDQGMVDIVDSRLRVTEAGNEQVRMVLQAAEDAEG